MNVASLEELIEKRKRLIDAHNENGFADGIRALLTDLYPDTAHFIYELLQNAEDMNATKVTFILKDKELLFAHNGTKRDFNLDDIDAITNIGHNAQKRNDPTSIGKFGVGFKAVFSYTATPEIHSGSYDFKIQDYFLPSTDGVQHIDTLIDGQSWTCFILPFNNPKKLAIQAFKEVLEGLQQLDENSILFLKNIRSIEFALPDGNSGYIKTSAPKEYYLEVRCKKHDHDEVKTSVWLRFLENIELLDEQGKNKNLCVGIAYHLLPVIGATSQYAIDPIKGKTFIYFPATKEESHLKFHINAPFASTVARDSIRECPQNQELIDTIAELAVKSLAFIKEESLLNISFLAVLPNDDDELSVFFSIIAKKIYHAFSVKTYLPTYAHGFETAGNVLRAVPVLIRNVFDNQTIGKLTNSNKVWCANPPLQNQREDRFLSSLKIETFDFRRVALLFKDEFRSKTEEILQVFSDEKLRDFYALLCKCEQELSYQWELKNLGEYFKKSLEKTVMIKTTRGYKRSCDAYLLPINQKILSSETPIIPRDFYDVKNINKTTKSDILSFFNLLEIQEYGLKTEIERTIELYKTDKEKNSRHKNGQYYTDIIAFSEYNNEQNDIDFAAASFILATRPEDHKLFWVNAENIIIGNPYENNAGEEIAAITHKFILWEGYSDISNIPEKKLPKLIAFFKKLGVRSGLQIQPSRVQNNPEYLNKLYSRGRATGYGKNVDYSIPDLNILVNAQSPKISLEIWNVLINCSGYIDVTIARHSANASESCNQADSTLVYYLKKHSWIPTKDGSWKRPAEISRQMLLPEFHYSEENKMLKAIGFGEDQKKTEGGRRFAEEIAQKAGGIFISQEDLPAGLTQDELKNEFQQFLKSKQKGTSTSELNQKTDLRSALRKQNQGNPNVNIENDDFQYEDDGAVPNIQRRTSKLIDSFIESKNTPVFVKKRMQRIADSNADEREQLEVDYSGKCQICGERITSYSGKRIFHAINIIDTSDLPTSLANTFSLCWNSICLCPNCAAKYKHCTKNMDRFEEQVISAVILEGDGRKIPISIQLDGKECPISYTPRHFLALKTAIKLLIE